MNLQDMPDFDAHEEVRLFELKAGAQAIIAVHSTDLGPAAGGCRLWRYEAPGQALSDALRLSRGMSYKNATAGLPLGGGKAVIIAPGGAFDRAALFQAFGRAVESFGGRYITAEDVGSGVGDMTLVATQTRHVGGLPAGDGQAGGDPSPWTALGVFLSLRAALAWKTGRSLAGAKVTVQGAGAVGAALCRRLADAGASVTIADIDSGRAQAVAEATGAYVAAPQDIHRLPADVFAPCALGAGLNSMTINDLGAAIVCGAANNQLADAGVGAWLNQRGVLYCPDYVVNAGGIIAVHGGACGQSVERLQTAISAIPERLLAILQTAQAEGSGPGAVADRMARDRIGRGRARRAQDPALAAAPAGA